MRQQQMGKLTSWRVNERIYVVDEKSHEEPLRATLVDIEPDLVLAQRGPQRFGRQASAGGHWLLWGGASDEPRATS